MAHDDLHSLLENDSRAYEMFTSMPIYVQDKIREARDHIRTREELSGYANRYMGDGLKRDEYRPMFEDSGSNEIDFF